MSAITFDGKVLWTRDPFADAHLEPYRVHEPKIVAIGQAEVATLPPGLDRSKAFIAISFNSTQFGVAETKTGDFTFIGQD